MRATPLVACGLLLMGCASNRDLATLSDGACSAFPRPTYQVKGRTAYDQRWADKTTEAGIAGCRWKRPLKRPASLMPVKAPIAAPLPPKKPSLLQRLRSRLHKF